jgi:hypothetical protein
MPRLDPDPKLMLKTDQDPKLMPKPDPDPKSMPNSDPDPKKKGGEIRIYTTLYWAIQLSRRTFETKKNPTESVHNWT